MKKITMTLVILLGLTMGAFAQQGGLFGMGPTRGEDSYNTRETGSLINLPGSHGDNADSPAPLGSGTVLMLGLGAAYLVSKKRNNK